MTWRGFKRRADDYWRSNTFAIVVAPAAMSLIGLLLVDMWGHPGWAVVVTFVIVIGLSALFIALPRRPRDQASLASADETTKSVDALALFLSTTTETTAAGWRAKSGQATLINALHPSHIVAVGTEQTADPARFLRDLYGSRVDHVNTLDSDETDDARAARNAMAKAIGQLLDLGATDVAVDITGGSKLMSIGAYEAAAAAGVMAVYLTREQPTRVMRVLDPLRKGEE